MDSVVPENLEERFTPPAGWQWGEFERAQGRRIRYGFCLPENARSKAVLTYLPGMGEPAEKIFETARYFLERNLAVYVMDWYGQGGSGRYLDNPHKRHAAAFDNDLLDLDHFLRRHVDTHKETGAASSNMEDILENILEGRLEESTLPLIMLAHSMGGNLGLRYLHDHPDVYDCAIFSAPMLGVFATRLLQPPFDLIVSGWLESMAGEHYVPGEHDWDFKRRERTKHVLTSDPVRGSVQNQWFAANPRLQIGNVTYGWVHEALKSCDIALEQLPEVKAPCLISVSGKDMLVDNRPIRQAAQKIPKAGLLEIPKARHEILMEADLLRDEFLDKALHFIRANTKVQL